MRTILLILMTFLSFTVVAKPTLIININGYHIVEQKLTDFKALAFENNKVIATYQNPSVLDLSKYNVLDGNGNTLLPGLIDSHGHVMAWGQVLSQVNLLSATSEVDAVVKVQRFSQDKELEWVVGFGWNQEHWQDKEFPSAKTLDRVFPDIPVWLTRIDGHAGWANSAAMELAGVSKATQDPEGGEILRLANGQPSGVFVDNAMELITNQMPPQDFDYTRKMIQQGLQDLARYGLTSVHDAGVTEMELKAYIALADDNEMPIRSYIMLDANIASFRLLIKDGAHYHHNGKAELSSVKILADGALGSRGAALLQGYHDRTDYHGEMLLSDKELESQMYSAMMMGLQVNTHAIGDKANRKVLDAYEKLIKLTKTEHLRHRIEHAQVLDKADIPRIKQLGLIASMQPTHATSDMHMAEDRLGEARLEGAYAWRTLLENGTQLAFGSDFPIEHANPFYGIHAALTRQNHKGMPHNGWRPQEALTLTQALKAFTIDGAYAARQERKLGSLESGKLADFIIIDRDITKIAPSQVWQTQVLQTWVDGEKVYQKPD
ncbi:amidohydrolase [Paraferrimonas sp. SM1919]|uniref:amidohydrolase n=1 Tax=Paraferrimonas sp. SM1919 TaxID=2662263 RepID=UPI001F0A0461|nr:amidohydrolase [Paraferrimonas sp. SM1919]